MNRRQFISIGGLGILLSVACQEKKQASENSVRKTTPADPCEDLSQLTETDLQLRKAMSYVRVSEYEDQLCDNCQFWIAPKEGAACGGCVSIKGPIQPKGYCSYWAPRIE